MWPKNEAIITPIKRHTPAFLFEDLWVSGIRSAADKYMNVPAVNAKKLDMRFDIWFENISPTTVPTGVNTATANE